MLILTRDSAPVDKSSPSDKKGIRELKLDKGAFSMAKLSLIRKVFFFNSPLKGPNSLIEDEIVWNLTPKMFFFNIFHSKKFLLENSR